MTDAATADPDATPRPAARRPDPTTLGYGVIPTSRKGRLICGAVFAVLFLVAVAIVGRGSVGSVEIEGATTEFATAAGDGGLPAVPGLGPWEYTAGTWTVDRGAVGQPSDAAVTLATVTHAYGGAESVRDAGEGFRSRVSEAEILVHPQDDRERDILDGDGVADFAGGFAAAAALRASKSKVSGSLPSAGLWL